MDERKNLSLNKQLLFKNIDEKTVVWFENSNQYVVLEKKAAEIIAQLHKGVPLQEIAHALSKEIEVPIEELISFIQDLEKNVLLSHKKENSSFKKHPEAALPTAYRFSKYYQIEQVVFKIDFLDEFELSLVHPKFAHLEISAESSDFNYQVFTEGETTFLYIDTDFIGAWDYSEIHYFQGKLSMQIIQHLHQKPEDDWLGVFHASAVSDGTNGMLFLGDSGNGKSTSLALLQANGFHCIADDFVPVSALTQDIFSFPAAISIKKNSLDVLLPFYPELKTSAEYHFTRLNKIVRFLPPKNKQGIAQVPCKSFVFIKYDKEATFELTKLSNATAFEKLIPDSWLSPIAKNVTAFLDWFSEIPCYSIRYSDNDKMITEVSKLFQNVL
jgi:hypothetical protein